MIAQAAQRGSDMPVSHHSNGSSNKSPTSIIKKKIQGEANGKPTMLKLESGMVKSLSNSSSKSDSENSSKKHSHIKVVGPSTPAVNQVQLTSSTSSSSKSGTSSSSAKVFQQKMEKMVTGESSSPGFAYEIRHVSSSLLHTGSKPTTPLQQNSLAVAGTSPLSLSPPVSPVTASHCSESWVTESCSFDTGCSSKVTPIPDRPSSRLMPLDDQAASPPGGRCSQFLFALGGYQLTNSASHPGVY